MNPPPPIPKPSVATPEWALDIGAPLKEDKGGKYYEVRWEITDKIYVYPHFRVEQTSAFVRRPIGYKGKRQSRQNNAISPIKAPSVPKKEANEERIVEVEEW